MQPDNPKSATGPVAMVDDNPGDRVLAKLCFDRSRLAGDWGEFSGGRSFLDHLEAARRDEAAIPRLVLLDINMPDMTGFEVLEAVRADPFFDEVPIICMLTSTADPRDHERAKASGASGFFTKPHDIDDYVRFFDSIV